MIPFFIILEYNQNTDAYSDESFGPPYLLEFDECPGYNTIKEDQKCRCLDSFIYGDPYSKKGCWKCINSCLPNASCVFPGRCQCREGLFGNGYSICRQPYLFILSISKTLYKENVEIPINFTYHSEFPEVNFTSGAFYCKFESENSLSSTKKSITSNIFYSEGKILDAENELGQCLLPKLNNGVAKLYISIDNQTWNKEPSLLVIEKSRILLIHLSLMFVFLVVFSIAGFILFKFSKSDSNPVHVKAFSQIKPTKGEPL